MVQRLFNYDDFADSYSPRANRWTPPTEFERTESKLTYKKRADSYSAASRGGDSPAAQEQELRSKRWALEQEHKAIHKRPAGSATEKALDKMHAKLMDVGNEIDSLVELKNKDRFDYLQSIDSGPISETAKAYYLSSGITAEEMTDVLKIIRGLESGNSSLTTKNNSVVPLTREEIWKKKMDLLNEAIQKPIQDGKPVEIDLEYYELTSPEMIDKLKQALKGGAKVRILVDPGTVNAVDGVYNPGPIAGRLRTLNLLTDGLGKADLGIAYFPNAKLLNKQAIMHRKIFRVGNSVIFGGMNGNTGSGEDIDMALLLRGEAATKLVNIFKDDVALSQNATAREIYGTQIQLVKRSPSVALDREGLMDFLESLAPVKVGEGESWIERVRRVLYSLRQNNIDLKKIFPFPYNAFGISRLDQNSEPVPLTPQGRALFAGKMEEMTQYLEKKENQAALSDVTTPSEVTGNEQVAIANSSQERQALILYGIDSAEKFIKMPAFVLTKDVAAALAAKKEAMDKAGKDFKIEITMDPGLYEPWGFCPNEKTYNTLQDLGIPVKWVVLERSTNDHDRKLHAKMMLTDKLVITGSTNFSAKGLRQNWELTGAWFFNPADKPYQDKLVKDFDKLYCEESLAPNIKAMAAQTFVNYQKPDRDIVMEEYRLRKVRHFSHNVEEFEKQTGKWMEAFANDPFNKKQIDDLVAQGYHRGCATFMVAGPDRVKRVRENCPAWKKMQAYWNFTPISAPITVTPPVLPTNLKEEFTHSLIRYHRLDGQKDGSILTDVQYPPTVTQGDEKGLRDSIDKLTAYLVQQPGITFLAPPDPNDRTAFREKVAQKALPEIKAHVEDEFNAIVESLKDPAIKAYVKRALASKPPEFFRAPSSSTGKYHPADEINEGGLLLHTIRDVKVGRMLAQYFGLSPEKEDEISAALILHDIQKGGIPWKKDAKAGDAPYSGYDPAHGPVAENWLTKFEDPNSAEEKAIEDEVGTHMAQWNEPNPTPPKNLEEQIVSYADYLASIDDVYVDWRGN